MPEFDSVQMFVLGRYLYVHIYLPDYDTLRWTRNVADRCK